MNRHKTLLRATAPMALLLSLAGCGTMVAGAAGAGAAIAYNERGVSTRVEGDINQVAQRTEAVFAEMAIAPTEVEYNDDGDEVEIKGMHGNMRVTVDIERKSDGLSEVQVTAREGTLDYDRDYARSVIAGIIAKS